MRRADLHPGGTVNNVLYVDYLQEARLDLLRHHDTPVSPTPGEGLVVVRTVIEYLRPLRLADAPLYVATWVSEVRAASFTLGYELFTRRDIDQEQVVHARATTVLTPYVFSESRPRRMTEHERAVLSEGVEPAPLDAGRPSRPSGPWGAGASRKPVHVRFSDVDVLGHVNNVRYLDYVQDSTVELMISVFHEAHVNGTVDLVIARTEIDYVGQMNLRAEPYEVASRIAAVGSTSLTFESEILDGDRVMARCRIVEVNIDEDDKPTPLHPRHREIFERRMRDAALEGAPAG
jgi:acyl-CoA thioester hydrolase